MLLLSKIGEEVKREARVEEQRRKVREEAHRKVQWALTNNLGYFEERLFANFDILKCEFQKWPKLKRIAIDGETQSSLNLNLKGWSEMGPVSRK